MIFRKKYDASTFLQIVNEEFIMLRKIVAQFIMKSESERSDQIKQTNKLIKKSERKIRKMNIKKFQINPYFSIETRNLQIDNNQLLKSKIMNTFAYFSHLMEISNTPDPTVHHRVLYTILHILQHITNTPKNILISVQPNNFVYDVNKDIKSKKLISIDGILNYYDKINNIAYQDFLYLSNNFPTIQSLLKELIEEYGYDYLRFINKIAKNILIIFTTISFEDKLKYKYNSSKNIEVRYDKYFEILTRDQKRFTLDIIKEIYTSPARAKIPLNLDHQDEQKQQNYIIEYYNSSRFNFNYILEESEKYISRFSHNKQYVNRYSDSILRVFTEAAKDKGVEISRTTLEAFNTDIKRFLLNHITLHYYNRIDQKEFITKIPTNILQLLSFSPHSNQYKDLLKLFFDKINSAPQITTQEEEVNNFQSLHINIKNLILERAFFELKGTYKSNFSHYIKKFIKNKDSESIYKLINIDQFIEIIINSTTSFTTSEEKLFANACSLLQIHYSDLLSNINSLQQVRLLQFIFYSLRHFSNLKAIAFFTKQNELRGERLKNTKTYDVQQKKMMKLIRENLYKTLKKNFRFNINKSNFTKKIRLSQENISKTTTHLFRVINIFYKNDYITNQKFKNLLSLKEILEKYLKQAKENFNHIIDEKDIVKLNSSLQGSAKEFKMLIANYNTFISSIQGDIVSYQLNSSNLTKKIKPEIKYSKAS